MFLATILYAAPASPGVGAPPGLPLREVIRLAPQTVPPGKSVQLPLPPLPGKPGKAIVLRFRAVCRTATAAGCNYHAALSLNDSPVGRYTSGGEERLIARSPAFELQGHEGEFQVFSGNALMTMFAPDARTADSMTSDGLGAIFALDISDIARGVDGNTLTIRNTLTGPPASGSGDLLLEEIEIGWLDRAAISRPEGQVPQRGEIAASVSAGGLRLAQGRAGGFAVQAAEGVELIVETALGMKADTPSALRAEDGLPSSSALREGPSIDKWGPNGYRVTASWPSVRLTRTLSIEGSLVIWKERWTNTGDRMIGVPFRHRLFLRGEAARFWLGGSHENTALAATSQNPTMFLESRQKAGDGLGITAESDWLRLLMWLRARSGIGEVYSETLALAPGSSVDFEISIAPVRGEGGYWSFINGVRGRWGLNRLTQERPAFWGYARAEGSDPDDTLRKSLGHLGPVTLVLGPWQRLEPDARTVMAGHYPKLPADAPRTPGGCPDLDVEAFLTFKHREVYWKRYSEEVQAIRRACPGIRVIQMMHPAMEAVYKPLQDRWPIAHEAIQARDGAAFEDEGYSRSWVGDMVSKDWGVLYYAPRPGSRYLQELLAGMRRSMDEYHSDGIYCDEFGWGYQRRGYSRYDYSRWDGYSADLDAEGRVVRLKCDNAYITESAQMRIAREVLSRGKFFLANGAASLRSITSLPYSRFVEGGNGYAWMASAHLNPTPLILGNMGNESTRQGIFGSVKTCLSVGCVYSPMDINLLLEGPDNFVCKLYPLTVLSIGPGWVQGQERLIAAVSGSFSWPGPAVSVRLYCYSDTGELLSKEVIPLPVGRKLDLKVPEKGLVIAEAVGGV